MYHYIVTWPTGYWLSFFADTYLTLEGVQAHVTAALNDRRDYPELYGTGARAIKDDGFVRVDVALPYKGD